MLEPQRLDCILMISFKLVAYWHSRVQYNVEKRLVVLQKCVRSSAAAR